MPRFSVVVPTYNRAERLSATLRSVLEQTFPDFELLVMDDGSTDHTRGVVESLGDVRIKYSWADNSGGPATPRNRGIDAADGEWVCFLDADDIWYPEKLKELDKEIAREPYADVICNDEYLVLFGSGIKKRLMYGPFVEEFYRAMLIGGNRCSTSATSIKKSFLDKHHLRFNMASNYVIVEDYDLWLRLARAGARFNFLDLVLGEYLIEADNISLNTKKFIDNLEALLRDHVYELQSFDSDKERLWRHVSIQLQVARSKQLVEDGDLGAALKLAFGTLIQSPAGAALFLLSRGKRGLRKMVS